MLMAHRGAEPKLQVDDYRRADHDAAKGSHSRRQRTVSRKPPPKSRGRERDDNHHSKKRLGEEGVKNSDFIFQQGHAQSAQDALENYGAERGEAEVAEPAPVIDAPDPDGEHDRQEPDDGSDETMGVLEENPADPFGDGEAKHVVTKCGRPIGHGETDAFARDHAAAANEKEGRDGGEPGETMQPPGAAIGDRGRGKARIKFASRHRRESGRDHRSRLQLNAVLPRDLALSGPRLVSHPARRSGSRSSDHREAGPYRVSVRLAVRPAGARSALERSQSLKARPAPSTMSGTQPVHRPQPSLSYCNDPCRKAGRRQFQTCRS